MTYSIDERAMRIARRIVQRKHDAVIAGDIRASNAASRHYERLVQALNGGTLFASRSGPEAPGCQLETMLAAPDGENPKWSQSGRFFVSVNGMPCVVVYEGDGFAESFSYHAIAFDRPFISQTGYKSDYFFNPVPGTTVKELAIQRLTQMQLTDMCVIEPSSYSVARNEFAGLPFVVKGLAHMPRETVPAGTRVRVKRGKDLGLVTDSEKASVQGKIEVALFALEKKSSRHRQAPLSTVRRVQLWPWEVTCLTDQELVGCSEPGKYLTLGMIEALDAIDKVPQTL